MTRLELQDVAGVVYPTQTNRDIKTADWRKQQQNISDYCAVLKSNNPFTKRVSWGSPSNLQVNASDEITVTSNYHTVTPNTGTIDRLETINGGVVGQIIVLTLSSSSDLIRIKNNTGNINGPGSSDMLLDHVNDTFTAIYTGSKWLRLGHSINE